MATDAPGSNGHQRTPEPSRPSPYVLGQPIPLSELLHEDDPRLHVIDVRFDPTGFLMVLMLGAVGGFVLGFGAAVLRQVLWH
jgi:hypothetical protein